MAGQHGAGPIPPIPELDEQVRDALENALFLWLATTSPDGLPCLAPKELFTHWQGQVLIADSKDSDCFDNLLVSSRACMGFIHPLTALGFQIHADVEIVERTDPRYEDVVGELSSVIHPDHPFETVYSARPFSTVAVPLPVIRSHPHRNRAQMIEDRWRARGRV